MELNKLPHDHGQSAEQVMAQCPSADDFQKISDLLRQLGDSTRVRLFWILCHCEECVINLSAMMDMSSPAVSHHLRQLRTSQLIVSRREGKEVYYKAADNIQAELFHHLIEQMLEISCPHPTHENAKQRENSHHEE